MEKSKNHGPLKIQWFLLNEICADTHLLVSCGKDSSKKFHWKLAGKRVPNWESLFVHRKQGLFLSENVDDIRNGRKEAEYGSHVEETDGKC